MSDPVNDLFQLRIMDAIISMLTNPALDTEDVIEILTAVSDFVTEQIANAEREASPG